MVYRVYAEKKPGFDHEAAALYEELKSFLGIEGLEGVRILNRYDVENIDEALFEKAVSNVFSEPMVDNVTYALPEYTGVIFAAEYLPGQFDQRADSAAQCIQLLKQVERPDVRTATVYILAGSLSAADIEAVKKHVINPVERREASLDEVATLKTAYAIPTTVETMTGFIDYTPDQLNDFIRQYGLAMDAADIAFCQTYFKGEHRDPTLTEIRMIDTYWSDHCRHTTFLTELGDVTFEDQDVEAAYKRYLAVRGELNRTKPVCLMDIATIGAKYLKEKGVLTDLDESEEINACTIKMAAVQERDPQPSHRDRALRRRGHLHRRRDPRPAVRARLRLPGHARHRRGRSHPQRGSDHPRQAAPAPVGDNRRGGLFQLWQPDRPGHWTG